MVLFGPDNGSGADGDSTGEKSSEGKSTGLKSPYGSRGALCAHYHWSWDYLHWNIRWAIVQRMLIDAPGYTMPKTDGDKPGDKVTKLTAETAPSIMQYINSLDFDQ